MENKPIGTGDGMMLHVSLEDVSIIEEHEDFTCATRCHQTRLGK